MRKDIRIEARIKFFICFLSVMIFLLAGNASADAESQNINRVEPPQGVRDKLTFDDLMNANFPELVHNDYFMPIGSTAPPAHMLSGEMNFSETSMNTSHPDSTWLGRGMRFFPGFSVSVISYGESLIPLDREIILSGDEQNSFWNVIVSPGRVWQEPWDNGYSRASFPFTFTDNYIGQARNGLATFVYNSSEISDVAIQITQETSPVDGYEIANFKAVIPARYTPSYFEDTERLILDFEKELAKRPPVRPWSELPQEYLHSMWINNIELSIGVVTMPSMNGHVGNFVVILPSGVVAIRFSDSNHYDISHMIAVAEFYGSNILE